MSEEDSSPNACWGGNLDTDHLGDVLIEMGERLKDDDKGGFGLQGATFRDIARYDEFAEHELTIQYAKGGITRLGDPIKYTQDAEGNDREE